MIDAKLEQLLIGKEIKSVEFRHGVSSHCNYVKNIIFTDGMKLHFRVEPKSDFRGQVMEKQIPWIWDEVTVNGELKKQ